MNIISTNEKYKAFWRERQKANKGCYVCPCCGEWKQSFIYDMLGENTFLNRIGIDIHTERRQIYDIESNEFRVASVDCFQCNNCKSEWESNPFDWGDDNNIGNVTYNGETIDEDDNAFIFINDL